MRGLPQLIQKGFRSLGSISCQLPVPSRCLVVDSAFLHLSSSCQLRLAPLLSCRHLSVVEYSRKTPLVPSHTVLHISRCGHGERTCSGCILGSALLWQKHRHRLPSRHHLYRSSLWRAHRTATMTCSLPS